MEDLHTITSVACSPTFTEDRIWLNGQPESVAGNRRMEMVFSNMRALASHCSFKDEKVHIVSTNSFPTAAGLASSASGFACLVKALAILFEIVEEYPGQLSEIARMGSGSASRSLFGGFSKWQMGQLADGKDSIAVSVAPESHWNDIHAIICVASSHKKLTSSTGGMIDSVRTSELLDYRAKHVVPKRMEEMELAIKEKDFVKFATLTMKDSNQFHATCLDTYPPIAYMTDVSHQVSRLVHEINAEKVICAYTFDAGPNAVIFVQQENVQHVLQEILKQFGPAESSSDPFVRGKTILNSSQIESKSSGLLHYIIHTKIGKGAEKMESTDPRFLINVETGLAK